MTKASTTQAPTEPPPSPDRSILAEACFGQQPPERGDPRGKLACFSESALLGLMANQDTEPTFARDAWDELYRRHCRCIFQLVARNYGQQLGGEDGISDVVVDTFHAAFDWATRQASPESVVARFEDVNLGSVRRKVLGWLCVIARRIAAHRITSNRHNHLELRDVTSSEVDDQEPPSTALRDSLQSALQKLSPTELEALRVSLPWYQVETGQFAFSRGEAAAIASSLGITADALRQRRHRSLERLALMMTTQDTNDL